MPSPRQCRYGNHCFYGPGVCKYSHSADNAPVVTTVDIRIARRRRTSSGTYTESRDFISSEAVRDDFEEYDSELVAGLSGAPQGGYPPTPGATPVKHHREVTGYHSLGSYGEEEDASAVPTLQALVCDWFARYFAEPSRAEEIVQLAETLYQSPSSICEAVLERLTYIPLVQLQRTKCFEKVIKPGHLARTTTLPNFRVEGRALMAAVQTYDVGSLAGSDEDWIDFRAHVIRSPRSVQQFRMLYEKRLPIMQTTLNSSSRKDYLHSLNDCLEELRREAGLPQWPRWRLSDPNHGHASAADAAHQNMVLRVWMEKMRAALAYV